MENLSLFEAMFPTEKGATRSFSWQHFLQAMTDAGFSVTQGSGSAVSFQERTWDDSLPPATSRPDD